MIISISPERSNTSDLACLGSLFSQADRVVEELHGPDWLAFAATVLGVFPIYAEAWENLRKRRMTMEISMTIALVAALCIGQFVSGDLIWGQGVDMGHILTYDIWKLESFQRLHLSYVQDLTHIIGLCSRIYNSAIWCTVISP
jgi:hypothetical protein